MKIKCNYCFNEIETTNPSNCCNIKLYNLIHLTILCASWTNLIKIVYLIFFPFTEVTMARQTQSIFVVYVNKFFFFPNSF